MWQQMWAIKIQSFNPFFCIYEIGNDWGISFSNSFIFQLKLILIWHKKQM